MRVLIGSLRGRPRRDALELGRGGPARVGGRWYRGLSYLWHLLLWSRISVGRAGLVAIELQAPVLRRKGVHWPPPRLDVTGHPDAVCFRRGFAEIYALLFANLQTAGLLSSSRHAIPGPAFRGVYLWDSAFIAQVWRWWDWRVAADVVTAVIDLRDGDRLQHVVSEFHRSAYTQPPVLAWSLQQLAYGAGNADARGLIEKFYRPLCAYHRWLNEHRRLADGLYAWAHPYESGVENAPRFSNADESSLRNTGVIGAVDFSSYVVLQCDALAEMAEHLGDRASTARFRRAAGDLRGRINRLLWDEVAGTYFDRDGAGVLVRVETIASLMPLWAGVPDPRCARQLVKRILDPECFGTLMPLPSVARNDPSFEKDMWRGPVWLNTAYAVVRGLLRYGYQREAGEIAYRLCLAVYRVFEVERRVYEFYDPDRYDTADLRRKRGNRWKGLTLGNRPQRDFVGWTGLVNNLLLEVLLGLEVGPRGTWLCPRLPRCCTGMTLNLELQHLCLRLTLHCEEAEQFTGWVEVAGRSTRFKTGLAEPLRLLDGPCGDRPCVTAI